jgi:rhodanese-related sulfurtransferase
VSPWLRSVGFGLALTLASPDLSVVRAQSSGDDADPEISGGPYCGVYCVYAALHSLGIESRFEDLLDSRYIGSRMGSSLGELRRAVADFGARAEAMEGMTEASLRASRHPVIMHVRRPGKGTPYAHWVLFLGLEGNAVRLIDPPNPMQPLPLADLLALWDGVGLVVAKEAPPTTALRASSWLDHGIVLLTVVGVLGLARLVVGRGPRRLALLGLPAVAVAMAVTAHLVHQTGFFSNRAAVAQVAGRYFEDAIPTVNRAEVVSLVGHPGVTIIDARIPRDYRAGHLPAAVNLPVYAGLGERGRVLADVKPTDRVIVYCQSDKCPWGHVIASDLVLRGYTNVAVFPGGWSEWDQHEQSESRR